MRGEISPEFLKAMRETEQREREAAKARGNELSKTSTPRSLLEVFRPVIEAGLGDLTEHSPQVLEAYCEQEWQGLRQAMRAHGYANVALVWMPASLTTAPSG